MSAGPRYLKLRKRTWNFQLHVPADLYPVLKGEPYFDGRKIVRSTGEHDLSLAQPKALTWAGEYHRRFKQLRKAMEVEFGGDATTREIYRAKLAALKAGIFEVHTEGQFDPGDEHYDPEGDRLSLEAGILLEHGPKGPDGEPNPDPITKARLHAIHDYQVARMGGKTPGRHEYGMRFSDAAAKCMEEKARGARGIKKQSQGQYAATQRLFTDFIGDKAIRLVVKKDAAEFIDMVSKFDPQWGRGRGVKHMSISEIDARYGGSGEGLTDKTINRYLTALTLVWKWAKARGEASGGNPFEGLFRSKKPSATYTHFSDEDLEGLFTTNTPATAYLREVTLVGLYSGMRLNEICSLTWGDIKREDGVWFFDITEAKSEAGVRGVPIHSQLKWLVDRRESQDDLSRQVWPDIKPGGPDDKHSWKVSPAFTNYRRECGIQDKVGRYRKAFHSTRKNAVRCLELARVPQNEAATIIGHDRGFTYGTYNPDALPMKMRRKVVEKIRYPVLSE